jgi:N-acetylmuramoyl-L-alanine amidase
MATRIESIKYGIAAGTLLWVGKSRAAQSLTHSGRNYRSLSSMGSLYGMSCLPGYTAETYRNKYHSLVFEHDSRKCSVDGISVWLLHPVRKVGGSWAIYERDYTRSIDPLMRPYVYLKTAPSDLVMLDPGHGGSDSGACGKRNVKERLVTLDVAKRVERELKKYGIRVKKTRNGDETLSLSARTASAARAGASLFVSIHMNSSGSGSAAGTETYVLAPAGEDSSNHYGKSADKAAVRGNRHDAANMTLGFRLQQALIKTAKRDDRGVKRARFTVLAEAPCPAALVEGAFISNPDEEAKMIDSSFREALAMGIATGIREYLSLVKKSR